MRVLDLFSGIGGFSLGLERAGMQTVAFCEVEPFAQRVLRKHWPDTPIFNDVRTLDGTQFRGTVELVCGGFPCQPFSVAGKQKGTNDNRHLWPEMLRIIREVRPTWVIGENVSGFVNMALDLVQSDLENEGYQVQSFLIPACGVQGHHRRERCWIVAHSNSARGWSENRNPIHEGWGSGKSGGACVQNNPKGGCGFAVSDSGATSAFLGYTKHDGSPTTTVRGVVAPTGNNYTQGAVEAVKLEGASLPRNGADVADTERERERERGRCGHTEGQYAEDAGQSPRDTRNNSRGVESWGVKPGLGGTPDGLPGWMDGFEYLGDPDRFGTPRVTTLAKDRANRLKALGNAVVPQIPEILGRAIMDISCGHGNNWSEAK